LFFCLLLSGSGQLSTKTGNVLAQRAAIEYGKLEKRTLIDFSIYSLPVAEQNAFQLLLLIPVGALIIVILRNIVGIAISGTFMPILIAMVLLQTSLLTGIVLDARKGPLILELNARPGLAIQIANGHGLQSRVHLVNQALKQNRDFENRVAFSMNSFQSRSK
jgi:uncharacterized protein with transglutaminase domain/putative polysaccharide biosynthesis protein